MFSQIILKVEILFENNEQTMSFNVTNPFTMTILKTSVSWIYDTIEKKN